MELALGIAIILVAVAAGALGWVLQVRQNRRAMLRRILGRVDGRLVSSPWLLDDGIDGTHDGRAFRLRLGTRPSLPGGGDVYSLSASVELRHAPPITLRIRRDRGFAALEKALGRVRDVEVSGGDAFDRRYLVEADEAPAQGPLADAEVREAVNALLAFWDLDEVAIRDGWLMAKGGSHRMGQRLLHELLDGLEVLAQAYDRRPALEIGVQERFFWLGGGDQAPRCPYCHDTVDGEDDLSACTDCNTLIHPECHQENGGCPILGCGGRGADPVRPLRLKG